MGDFSSETTQKCLAELKAHMQEAGELEQSFDLPELDISLVLEQKMKLVAMPGSGELYAVSSGEDWMHDAMGETRAIPGTFYSDGEPFVAGSAAVTGYFQADADGRWVRIVDGAASHDAEAGEIAWRSRLEDFPEVVAELEACMSVSAYRHVAEQAAMKQLVGA